MPVGLPGQPIRSRGSGVWQPAAAGSFDPIDLSPSAWWKADALALANNDPVGTWTDSSGNSRNLTQATSAKRPTYKTAIQNGKPVVRFDGTDDVMRAAGFVPLNANGTALTGFIVMAAANTTQGHPLSTRSGSDGFIVRTNSTASTHWGYFAIGGGSATDAVTQTTWHVLEFVCVLTTLGSAGSMRSGHDGIMNAVVNTAPVITASAQTGVDVGAQNEGAGNHLAGDIGEILLYPTALSDADRANVESHLRTKWATP